MKKIYTPHSDENPELGEAGGGGSGSSLVCDEEGSAIDDLYKKERRLGVRPDENVVEYYEYVPDVQRD